MHFEILVEDQSGKKALEVLIPKIIGNDHTCRVLNYRGIGHIPKNLKSPIDAQMRMLLNQLPRLLLGYGKSFAGYPSDHQAALIIVCDLDNRCLKSFRQELLNVLNSSTPKPDTQFCIAIEEVEAWLLGDLSAIKKAYPKAKDTVLDSYKNDSICGTWEKLADALYSGGLKKLSNQGWQSIGKEKSIWAEKISPHMDVDNNDSPSFQYFRNKLHELTRRTT